MLLNGEGRKKYQSNSEKKVKEIEGKSGTNKICCFSFKARILKHVMLSIELHQLKLDVCFITS